MSAFLRCQSNYTIFLFPIRNPSWKGHPNWTNPLFYRPSMWRRAPQEGYRPNNQTKDKTLSTHLEYYSALVSTKCKYRVGFNYATTDISQCPLLISVHCLTPCNPQKNHKGQRYGCGWSFHRKNLVGMRLSQFGGLGSLCTTITVWFFARCLGNQRRPIRVDSYQVEWSINYDILELQSADRGRWDRKASFLWHSTYQPD